MLRTIVVATLAAALATACAKKDEKKPAEPGTAQEPSAEAESPVVPAVAKPTSGGMDETHLGDETDVDDEDVDDEDVDDVGDEVVGDEVIGDEDVGADVEEETE